MPEISRFLGIIITMYYKNHPPPHFHVRYNQQKAINEISKIIMLINYAEAMSIAKDGKNACNAGSASEHSIFCPVRVSAIFHVG
jgi:hypothetical protein